MKILAKNLDFLAQITYIFGDCLLEACYRYLPPFSCAAYQKTFVLMGYRPMAGHAALDRIIGVRIPVSQYLKYVIVPHDDTRTFFYVVPI